MSEHIRAPVGLALLERAGTVAGIILLGLVALAFLAGPAAPPRDDRRPDPEA